MLKAGGWIECPKDQKKSIPLYKICFWWVQVGAGSIPGAARAERGVCSEQLSQLRFTKAQQTVPKGQFLCSLDRKSTKQLLQLFRGQLDTKCVLGCLADRPRAEPVWHEGQWGVGPGVGSNILAIVKYSNSLCENLARGERSLFMRQTIFYLMGFGHSPLPLPGRNSRKPKPVSAFRPSE